MKKITLLFIGVFTWSISQAQDYIATKKAEIIEAKVIEVGTSDIKYKKWNYQDGPTYTISKETVSKIKYQNGDEEVFETMNVSSESSSVESKKQYSTSNNSMISQLSNSSKSKSTTKTDTCYKYEKFNFSLFFGPTFAVGKYGQTSKDDFSALYSYGTTSSADLYCGAASRVGAIIGFNLLFPVFKKNHHVIGVDLKNDLHFSTISQQEKEDFDNYKVAFFQNFCDEYYNIPYGVNAYQWMVGHYSTYWNYSLKLGLDYTYYFNKNIALTLNGNLGLQLNMVSRTKLINRWGGTYINTEYIEEDGQYVRFYSSDGVYFKYKPTCSLVYEFGIGILLGDVVSLNILYSAGTAHKHNMEILEYANKQYDRGLNPDYDQTQKLRIQNLALQLGFHF